MTPPIILTEEVVALGVDWAKRCEAAISDAPHECLLPLDDASVVSPTTGDTLPVRLYLSKMPMLVDAIVFPPHAKYLKADPDYSEDRYAVIVNGNGSSFKGPYRSILPAANVLHELTHVVDPLFAGDVASKQSWITPHENGIPRDYKLASEQRAFTAMWTAYLKQHLRDVSMTKFRADDFSQLAAFMSPEFRGFYEHDFRLQPQIHDHFTQMATAVASRTESSGEGAVQSK